VGGRGRGGGGGGGVWGGRHHKKKKKPRKNTDPNHTPDKNVPRPPHKGTKGSTNPSPEPNTQSIKTTLGCAGGGGGVGGSGLESF